MKKSKKIVILVFVVALIGVAFYIGITYSKKNSTNNINTETGQELDVTDTKVEELMLNSAVTFNRTPLNNSSFFGKLYKSKKTTIDDLDDSYKALSGEKELDKDSNKENVTISV